MRSDHSRPTKITLILFSLLSGLLLSLAWPERGWPGLLFVGLVPLLWLEDHIRNNSQRFVKFAVFWYTYPGFFLWNLLTTWWIYNSTGVGALMAVGLNALFMAIVFSAYHFAVKKLQNPLGGYLALICFWLAFEYLHLNWILNWPWLNLGNGFASWYKWVQWYEYTGAMGGTLWILIANILLAELIRQVRIAGRHSFRKVFSSSSFIITFSFLILWIVLPLLISFSIYHGYSEKSNPVEIVVVQPNIDPYSEQYNLPPVEVIGRIMQLAAPLLDSNTAFLIAPESAIQESIWENDLRTFTSLMMLQEVIRYYPGLNILVGGSTFRMFRTDEPLSRTARKFRDSDGHYDAFNTAILINSSDSLQLYHKSKLTPGVEALPSFRGFKWLENFALDLGGTVGSLGTDRIRKVFHTTGDHKASPVICYESVFGEFYSEYVRNGAKLMIIITNDGWWGNTGGFRQHFAFSHLRAIETRRSIARSANTGISAFIDQRGDAHQQTGYWVPAAIKGTVNLNDRLTFYTRHGDYLARSAVISTFIILIWCIILKFRRK